MATFAESELARIELDLSYAKESLDAFQRVLEDPTITPLRRGTAERNLATYQKKIADLEAQKAKYQSASAAQDQTPPKVDTSSQIEKQDASAQTAEAELDVQGQLQGSAKGSIVSDTSAAPSRVRFANPAKVYDETTDTYSVIDETSGKTLQSGLTEQEAAVSEQELAFEEVDQELDQFELNNIEAADDGWTETDGGLLVADEDAWEEQDGMMVLKEDGEAEDGEPILLSSDDSGDSPQQLIGDQEGDYDGQINGATVGTTNKPVTVQPKSSVPSYSPQMNPLHSYATYTYSISLFILAKEDFTQLVKNPESWKPRNCLISSGGKHSTNFPRNPAFSDDFYFDGLKMTTVIGMNARSKSSNVIDLNFTIVEPYGLTLLNRIMDASISVNSPNYIEMPYLLQIDFYGNDDAGKLLNPIPGQTKRIPIKIIGIKSKVSSRGSEYQVQAVPFSHQALQENQATTPINLEVDASTVEDFFKNSDVDISAQKKAKEDAQRELISALGIQVDDDGNPLPADVRGLGGDPEKAAALKKTIASAYKSNSFPGAFNAWYKQMTATGASEVANEVMFKIDPDIAKTKITAPKRTDMKKTPIPNPGTKEAANINKKDAAGPDVNTSSFAINSGTSVMRVIDMVMRNSDYITSQISDPAKNATKDAQTLANEQNKPMNWYKVIPEIQLKEFDRKLNKWGTVTVFHIQKYIVYNTKHPWGPQSKPKGAVKEYNFIYTGKNNDIIDFNIDFDALYYTAVSLNRSKYEALTTSQGSEEGEKNNIPAKGGTNKAFTQKFQPRADDPAAGGMQGQDNSATKTATDIQNSIYSGSRGDMLNLKLKIIGDPQLIKQDDIYNNPGSSNYTDITKAQIIASNGSLVMDNGELYAKVSFKTPVDIDETTGLLRKNGKYTESVFSGMYKFLTVDNEFRGGKFEQTCDLVRMPDDVGQAPAAVAATNTNRPAPVKSLSSTRDTKSADDDSWSEENGMMILDEDKWKDEDGVLVAVEDEEEPFLLNPDDEDELVELSGTEDEEEQLALIVDETEEVDVIDWENEQDNKPESQPIDNIEQIQDI